MNSMNSVGGGQSMGKKLCQSLSKCCLKPSLKTRWRHAAPLLFVSIFASTEWPNRFIALVISTHFKHLAVGVITIATAFATICPNDPTSDRAEEQERGSQLAPGGPGKAADRNLWL
jgi:hypothetical protein